MFIKEYKGTKKRATLLCALLVTGMLVACGQESELEKNDVQAYQTITGEDIIAGDTSVKSDKSSNLKDSIAEDSTEKNAEYHSYQEAYLAIIKSSEIEGMDEEYNLIYFDDNDVPELVASKNDYYVSLYTYDDGSVFQLMDKWAYGAMGNVGYEYAPRQNSMRNYNTDYAGAICYTTYTAISEQYSMDVIAEIKFVNFDDVNGNGMPDENEEGSIGYYGVSYLNGVEATQEECAAYDKGEYEYIRGDMSLEELKAKLMEDTTSRQESGTQVVENTASEKKSEELLDLFINGSIDAIDSTDLTSAFNITDLNMDSGEWDSYSIGERVDLDNDGENELIICGPYGGIYLDARDNKVYELATGDGNANVLSYTYYNGAIWIMYSNSMNAGYEAYYMAKYEGADNLIAEIRFGEELIDANNSESGLKYIMNGNEISYDEYAAFCSKIFAAQVSTNPS